MRHGVADSLEHQQNSPEGRPQSGRPNGALNRGRSRIVVSEDPILAPGKVLYFPSGLTLAEMAAQVPLKHEALRRHLVAEIDGEIVPRERWRYLRVKAEAFRRVIVVFKVALSGGAGRGIVTALAAVALIGGLAVSGGALGSLLGPAFAAGGLGAIIGGAGLAAAGSVLLHLANQGLVNPRQDSQSITQASGADLGFATNVNSFEPGAVLQRCLGTQKVYPQVVVPFFTELDDAVAKGDGTFSYDQFGVIVLALAGKHEVDAVYMDDVEIDALRDVEVEIGDSTANLQMLDDYGGGTPIEVSTDLKLSEWDVTPSDALGFTTLNGTIAETKPGFHRVETKLDVEKFRMEFLLPQGLYKLTDEAAAMTLRIRGRRRKASGWGPWFNLPELVIRAYEPNSPLRLQLRIEWVSSYPAEEGSAWPPTAKAYTAVKGWAQPFISSAWSSPLYEASGSGFVGWHYESESRIVLYLKTDVYPVGRYQFEIERSWPFAWANYNTSTHQVSGIADLHGPTSSGGNYGTPENPAKFRDEIRLASLQNWWSEYPIANVGNEDTLIAIRVRNRQLGRISVVAGALMDDLVSGSWVADQRTDNPAAVYRHVLIGEHSARPDASAQVDADALADWHKFCRYTRKRIGLVAKGAAQTDVLGKVALSGWGVPIYGPKKSVWIERLRKDGPIGVISQRNAGRFAFQKEFADLPHAIRAEFADEDADYEVREITIYADGYNADGSGGLTEATKFETLSYESLPTEALVQKRGAFDLASAYNRTRLVTCEQDVEWLEHKPGALLLVETDIIGKIGGRGRIKEILTSGSNITGLVFDEARDFAFADIQSPADRGAALRLLNGDVLVKEVTSDDSDPHAIVFATPFTMPQADLGAGAEDLIVEGGIVVMGVLGAEARPMVLKHVEPGGDERSALLTFMDYASLPLFGSAFDTRSSRGFDDSFDASFG